MPSTPASVRLRELTKLFGATRAVDRVSLAMEPGSIVALLGPSGCGKTTTLRMIAGLLQPDAGDITIDGRSITRVPVHRRNVGMLFQNYALFPHMTVAENIGFGLETRRVKRSEAAARIKGVLQLVQLTGFEDRMPMQLSGGQQQRVALARALVVEPAVLLLDEPLGALDKSLRQSMQVELRDLQRRLGITTVLVTHDQEEALTMADRIAIMRDGYVEQSGAPSEVYQRPVSRFIASFLGVANFFHGKVDCSDNGTMRVVVPGGPAISVRSSRPVGASVTVALRPESVKVEAPEKMSISEPATGRINEVQAIVEKVAYHGFISHVYLRQPNGGALIAFQQNDGHSMAAQIAPGRSVRAYWSDDSVQVVRDEEFAASSNPGVLQGSLGSVLP
jgi:putative spermidine/putrescine transport system ATP-binding protein/spermidine/putrescine transport system ATP-binding protein